MATVGIKGLTVEMWYWSDGVHTVQFIIAVMEYVVGWSAILSRRSLRASNEKLRAACTTCRLLTDAAVPCVVSACVISTELHPSIHIMLDAVKPDDNQRARKQMSTPNDSSCTHILVFPTSATAQVSWQRWNHPKNSSWNNFLILANITFCWWVRVVLFCTLMCLMQVLICYLFLDIFYLRPLLWSHKVCCMLSHFSL